MDVEILNQKKVIDVISVIISSDKNDPDGKVLHMLFCMYCQNPICQYIGKVIRITPGGTPLSLPILLRCRRCQRVYQVEDIL